MRTTSLNPNKSYLIPIGGCGEFGMNATALIRGKNLYLIDCGSAFTDPRKLGTSSNFPDLESFLHKHHLKLKAYLITHGHEDHIGALAHTYRKHPAPIYATGWTCELIKRKFSEKSIETSRLNLVKAGEVVSLKGLSVEYIHVNHSIPDACSLYIKSQDVKIFHTGDFKIDAEPVYDAKINLGRIREIGAEGVDVLIADSTNAHKAGPSPSEADVKKPLGDLIKTAPGLVIVTTFASNFWRLKTIADICHEQNKKIHLAGRSLLSSFEIAKNCLGFSWPDDLFIKEHEISAYPRNRVVCLVTGSQGEMRAVLPRIAIGEHKKIQVKPNDYLVYSSRFIPGNEKAIYNVFSLLQYKGVKIITERECPFIHVSGHAYGGDLVQILNLVQPRTFMPVHGNFGHLIANQKLQEQVTFKLKDSVLVSNGELYEIDRQGVRKVDTHEFPLTYADEGRIPTLGGQELRQRLRIGESGLCVVSGVFSRRRRQFVVGPDFDLHGIPFDSPESRVRILKKAEKALVNGFIKYPSASSKDEVNDIAASSLRQIFYELGEKKPVLITAIFLG